MGIDSESFDGHWNNVERNRGIEWAMGMGIRNPFPHTCAKNVDPIYKEKK